MMALYFADAPETLNKVMNFGIVATDDAGQQKVVPLARDPVEAAELYTVKHDELADQDVIDVNVYTVYVPDEVEVWEICNNDPTLSGVSFLGVAGFVPSDWICQDYVPAKLTATGGEVTS